MNKNITSSACNLRLIDINKITSFAICFNLAIIKYSENGFQMIDLVPGSLKISDAINTENTPYYEKKHTFKKAGVSAETSRFLDIMTKQRFVALYTDEKGNERISGTPDYPLSLSYYIDEGLYNVTLAGKNAHQDVFLKV